MATKKVKLFERITSNKLEPFLSFEDFGLSFYNPNDLPKSSNLRIVDLDLEISFKNDQKRELAIAYNELRDPEKHTFNEENSKARKDLTIKIRAIDEEIQALSISYLEILAKQKQGDFLAKIEALYTPIQVKTPIEGINANNEKITTYQNTLDSSKVPQIEKPDLIELIFKEVNDALREYTPNELKASSETGNG
jgi:hypothetical protein